MDWNRYIGIPFRWGGYGFDGVFCWGLVWLFYRTEFGIELDRHDEDPRKIRDGRIDEVTPDTYGLGHEPVPVGKERPGDVLQMWGFADGRRLPIHCGIVVGQGKVLHIEQGAGSCIIDTRKKRDAWRPIRAWRHNDHSLRP